MYNLYGGILEHPPKKNEETIMKFTIRDLARQAIIASLYVVLTLAVLPIAFLDIQFRLSEVLMILVLFDKKSTIGLTIGCFFANFLNPYWMPLDLVIGTLGTLLGCLLMIPFRKNAWIALMFPVLTNALLVPITLNFYLDIPYWIGVAGVGIGELTMVYIVGNLVYWPLRKNAGIKRLFPGDDKEITV